MAVESKTLHLPSVADALPKQWEWQRLDQVCEGVFDCPHSTPVLTNEGPFVVRSQDVRSGIFRMESAGRVSDATYKDRIARAEPRHGDLVYSREGTYFGIAAELPQGVRVCLGQRMVLLRPDANKANGRFLRYWLNSPVMAGHIHGFRDGTVAERLNMPIIRGLPVALPPLAEQRAIAWVLGSLDDKIELNRRMNETLEALAQGLFKSWFVDATQSALPKDWRESELGEIAEVIDCLHSKKPARQSEGKPFLRLCNIRDDGLVDMTDTFHITEEDYRVWISRMEARAGDCVITNVGRVAATAQIPQGLSAALGRNMTGIRCRSSFPFPTFLIECLLSSAMKDEIALKTDTGTILDALNVRSIPKLRFIKPPNDFAGRFEKVARPLREKMERNFVESRTLAALRDALLPKLLSGELRVPAAATPPSRATVITAA
jgi:type I restriction enzyme S subunit